MSQYNLPALEDGFKTAGKSGAWLKVEHLEDLADAIRIGEEEAERGEVKSIPDPWAQLLVFDRALFDRTHPLHLAVRSQWRALIATLALWPEYEAAYTLSFKPIDLGPPWQGQAANGRRERDREDDEPDSLLVSTLKRLEPKRTLSPNLNWRQLWAIILEERGGRSAFAYGSTKSIGFLTPTALVASGVDGAEVRCAGVPWLEDGLVDPCETNLSDRQVRILADYLETVAKSLNGQNGLDDRITRDLSTALQRFHKDLEAKGLDVVRGLVEEKVALQGTSALHRELLGSSKKFDVGSIPRGEADAIVPVNGPAAKLFKGAILIDPALAQTLGKGPESISVWAGHSLADASRPATFDLIRSEAEADGWLVIRPQDLFTTALVELDKEAINRSHPSKFKSSLLPLTPLALLLMAPADIVKNLNTTGGSGNAQVRLALKLKSGQAHAVTVDLPRATGDSLGMPDDLAFWPDFKAPGWQWTFLHFTSNLTYDLRPRFAVTAETICRQIEAGSRDGSDRARGARLWGDPEKLTIDSNWHAESPRGGEAKRISIMEGPDSQTLMERMAFSSSDRSVAELHHLPLGADALFFARKREDGEFVPAGLALIDFSDPPSASLSATVAVDFGTTNTVLYTRINGLEDRLSFSDRILFPFQAETNQSRRREDLCGQYIGFFPLQTHMTPFPTVAIRRDFRPPLSIDLQSKARDGSLNQHGFLDNIFFMPNLDGAFGRQAALGVDSNLAATLTANGLLKFRLKWGETKVENALAKRFLRQVMMMTAAELVAKGADLSGTTWRYSYPQAFSPAKKRAMEQQVRQAWTELFDDRSGSEPNEGREFLIRTEGAAAANFFIAQAAETVMLMLDIGGGTTDVALWFDGKPLWRDSYRIAGGDFFTAYLANNPEVLRHIGMDEVVGGLTGRSDLGEMSRSDYVELYVNKPEFSRKFSDNFGLLATEPIGRGLEQVAMTSLGGIMFYVGMVLRRLLEDPSSPIKEASLSRMTVAFAGRGSTLFRQMSSGGEDNLLANLVDIMLASAGFNPAEVKVKLRFSGPAEAKHEVAKGLLIDRNVPGEREESRLTVLGEELTVTEGGVERQVAAGEPLSSIRSIDMVDEVEMTQFSNFLIALKKLTGLQVDVSSRGAVDSIRARSRQQLSDAVRDLEDDAFDDPDAQPFEPPFISALRQLVVIMAKPIEQRDAELVIKES